MWKDLHVETLFWWQTALKSGLGWGGTKFHPLPGTQVNWFHLCSQGWVSPFTRYSIIASDHELAISIHTVTTIKVFLSRYNRFDKMTY